MRRRLLIGLGLLIAWYPVTLILSWALFPLWSWVEATFGIESVGHASIASWCFWATGGVVALVLALAFASKWYPRRLLIALGLLLAWYPVTISITWLLHRAWVWVVRALEINVALYFSATHWIYKGTGIVVALAMAVVFAIDWRPASRS